MLGTVVYAPVTPHRNWGIAVLHVCLHVWCLMKWLPERVKVCLLEARRVYIGVLVSVSILESWFERLYVGAGVDVCILQFECSEDDFTTQPKWHSLCVSEHDENFPCVKEVAGCVCEGGWAAGRARARAGFE